MSRPLPPIEMISGDLASAAVKSSPGVAVTASAAAGMPIESWMAYATTVFVVLQTLYLLHKWYRELRSGRKEQADG